MELGLTLVCALPGMEWECCKKGANAPEMGSLGLVLVVYFHCKVQIT
jgi:hypothetical protein